VSTSKIFLNYTDYHDVDEEMRTIVRLGGYWRHDISAGVALRDVAGGPSELSNVVASSNIQNVKLYGCAQYRRRFEVWLDLG